MASRRTSYSPLLYVASVLLVVVAVTRVAGVRFTLTPSIPIGFYLHTKGDIERGQLVTFCAPEEAAAFALERQYLDEGPCPGGAKPLGKYVLALPGDTISIAPEGLSVNEQPVENSALYYQDRMGRELPHYPFGEHVVGPDSLFMFSGHHPRSYDSRYFGPVPQSSVISTARPLWTFD